MIIDFEKKIHQQITPLSWCKRSMKRFVWPFGLDKPPELKACCLVDWVQERYGPDHDVVVEKLNKVADIVGVKHVGNSITLCWVSHWNDKNDRTFDEVKEALIKADL